MGVIELTGKRFGRLTVVARDGSDSFGEATWRCRCECGSDVVVRGYKLRVGATQSCGCYNRDRQADLHHRHGHRRVRSREYLAWANAKQRCSDPRSTSYRHYGGRGILMCEAWANDFATFLRDMGPCPPRYQIDRINVNGAYEPGNCRWASTRVQSGNRRNNHYVEMYARDGDRVVADGERMSLTEAARRLQVSPDLVKVRLRRGWSTAMAFMLPTGQAQSMLSGGAAT